MQNDFAYLFSIGEMLLDTLVGLSNFFAGTANFGYVDVNSGQLITFNGSVTVLVLGGGLTFILGFRLVKFFTDLVL